MMNNQQLNTWSRQVQSGDFNFITTTNPYDETPLEAGLHVFLTLYFYETPSSMQRREEVYTLCERFVELTNELKLIEFGRGKEQKVGSKRGEIRGKKDNNDPKKDLYLLLSSANNINNASAFYFDSIVVNDSFNPKIDSDTWYSYLRMGVSHAWLQEAENKTAFMQLMMDAANTLNADQGYAGYGFAMPMSRDMLAGVEVVEYHMAHQFYGFDIDKPFEMSDGYYENHTLTKGLRAPSWCNFVSQRWLDKLGSKDAVVAELSKHPDVEITDYSNGIMIQTSAMPELYPVTEPVPHVMVHVAKVLRPIQPEYIDLLSRGRFAGDPDLDRVFFEPVSAISWQHRYDTDSTFPSADVRIPPETPQLRSATVVTEKRVEAGKPCPNTGYWFTPAKENSRAHFERGDTMPDFPDNDWGMTIWQWDEGPG